jgi:glutamine synthetase
MSSKICLEYVWIDGNETLRSKNRIINKQSNFYLNNLNLKKLPLWNFDGSSTNQTTGPESDIILKPIRVYKNPFIDFIDSYLVLCECYNKDMTPHITNTRVECIELYDKYKEHECLFGIEQEYTLFERNTNNLSEDGCNLPYMWKEHNNPELKGQGPYYCSIGGDRNFGRNISVEHLKLCLEAGIDICGTNSEVMASQWEYQIGICDALKVSDDLWISRYILQRITEKYNCYVSFHPKSYKGDWNGTGGHTNISTKNMRSQPIKLIKNDEIREKDWQYYLLYSQSFGINAIYTACEKLKLKHAEHMAVYGKFNDQRLSGLHETSSHSDFSYGVGNRACSVRIPVQVFNDTCGYLEDRRPASNLDPYLVTKILIQTICE